MSSSNVYNSLLVSLGLFLLDLFLGTFYFLLLLQFFSKISFFHRLVVGT